MKIGDHIKHVGDNTGEGPNGSWTITYIEDDVFGKDSLIHFTGGTHAPRYWVDEQMELGDARLIHNGEFIERSVEPHTLFSKSTNVNKFYWEVIKSLS
tara:strand:+ start:584 stop:877 length:294 start_codon:yes stop_codon:yes gene_type:complete